MRLKGNIINLTASALPRSLKRLHLNVTSQSIFLGAGKLPNSTNPPVDLKEYLPDLQLLSLVALNCSLPLDFVSSLPKNLISLNLSCILTNFHPSEISNLPSSLTLLHLGSKEIRSSQPFEEEIDKIRFPPQLLNLSLCVHWSLKLVPLITDSIITTLTLHGNGDVNPSDMLKALPRGLSNFEFFSPWQLVDSYTPLLPMHLKSLIWDNLEALTEAGLAALPRSLTRFHSKGGGKVQFGAALLGALPKGLTSWDPAWLPIELGTFMPQGLVKLSIWKETPENIERLPQRLEQLSLRSRIAWSRTHFEKLPESITVLHLEHAELLDKEVFSCLPKFLTTLTLGITDRRKGEPSSILLDPALLPRTLMDFTFDGIISDYWLGVLFELKQLKRLSLLQATPDRVTSKCLRSLPKSLTTLRIKFSDDLLKCELLPNLPPTLSYLTIWCYKTSAASSDLLTKDFAQMPIPLDHVSIAKFVGAQVDLSRDYRGRLTDGSVSARMAPAWFKERYQPPHEFSGSSMYTL
jgi:hypothetical protein